MSLSWVCLLFWFREGAGMVGFVVGEWREDGTHVNR